MKLQRTTLEQLLSGDAGAAGGGAAGGAPGAATVLAVQTGLGGFELADLLRRSADASGLQGRALPEAAVSSLCIMALAILRSAAAAVSGNSSPMPFSDPHRLLTVLAARQRCCMRLSRTSETAEYMAAEI